MDVKEALRKKVRNQKIKISQFYQIKKNQKKLNFKKMNTRVVSGMIGSCICLNGRIIP